MKKQVILIAFKNALIAVGGKPYVMSEKECKGFSYAITSDDIFFLNDLPKKMIVLGGGYIATECASFFNKLGSEVIMINRSKPLRAYDSQMSSYLINCFEENGLKMTNNARPIEIFKEKDGTLTVTCVDIESNERFTIDKVDVVLSAISRVPNIGNLNLKVIPEIKIDEKSKLIGDFKGEYDRVGESIYAIGDCLAGMPELTPVAIKSGRHLAEKIGSELAGMPHRNSEFSLKYFPTTIFCWPEYSFCGYSEDEAKKIFGKDSIVVSFHSRSDLLEASLEEDNVTKTYVKIVCVRQSDGSNKIVGMHFIGANAGEVMQGFAVN